MPSSIENWHLERLAAKLDGREFVKPPQKVIFLPVISEALPGCRHYDRHDGELVQCGAPAVERLVPNSVEDPEFERPVCAEHLQEYLRAHLLVH